MRILDEKTAVYWIWFSQLRETNPQQKWDLLLKLGDIDSIFNAQAIQLRAVKWMTKPALDELQDRDISDAYALYKACKTNAIQLLPCTEPEYPASLKEIPDPPVLLYYRGILPDFSAQPNVGIVGTRKATAYGLRMAQLFGRQIAACGALVISGGAAGVDTLAIRGALEAGKPVVAVVGNGLDTVYPTSNTQLFKMVEKTGCVMSEYPPGTPALNWHFPQRNRIISGIAQGVLVVEAPDKSGALITARQAKKYRKDVFVVPANLDAEAAKGSNALLQEKAMPAYSGWDVVKTYQGQYPKAVEYNDGQTVVCPLDFVTEPEKKPVTKLRNRNLKMSDAVINDKKTIDNDAANGYSGIETASRDYTPDEQEILNCLGKEPVFIDQIVAQVNMPSGKVMAILTMLAMEGKVVQHSGKRVSLR